MRYVSAMDIEDTSQVRAYLKERGWSVAEADQARIDVLGGGVSNRTVLVEFAGGKSLVLKQALEKLRVKADWFCSPERIHREAAGVRWLSEIAPAGAITPFVFEDLEHHVFAMEAVPQPHENWKTMLLRGDVQQDHVEQFGRLLGKMHRMDSAQRSRAQTEFSDRSFFESLRLEPYYAYSAQNVPEAADFLNRLIADTRAHRMAIVHGDYSPKNVLVHNGRLILLDHEVIHWGDPAFDVGFSMTHLLSKAHHLPQHRAAFVNAAQHYWDVYDDASNESRAVRHTLGCLLARVAGRSPLEYLNEDERALQKRAVLKLMAAPPQKIRDLIEGFIACL
jgi:5-methylthioribose kinase